MNDQISRQTPLPPTKVIGIHTYTKLQVHFGGDVQDIVLKTEKEPSCVDLRNALESTFRVPMANQLIYYRGQRLHQHQSASDDRPLSRYGIFSGNTLRLVGQGDVL